MPEGNKVLSRNIRMARKTAGLTQEKMAEYLHMTVLHYGRLERGERRTSFEQVEQIAKTLSISPYALIDGCFEGEPRPAFERGEISEMLDQLAGMLQGCTAEERELCFDLCERIARGRREKTEGET